jgi:hypothetical protein
LCNGKRTTSGRQPEGPSRPARKRWRAAVAELLALQAVYATWCEALPDSATTEALQEIADLDLVALAAIVPPRCYGRD